MQTSDRSRTAARGALAVALALAGVVALAPPSSQGQGRGAPDERSITVMVRGLRSDRGTASGGLYDSADSFPHGGREIATCSAPILHDVAFCRFEDVPPGRYAVALMHDEDADGRFDQGLFGIPEEGYGFSRDARGSLGAPSFESAAFAFDGDEPLAITINIRYGI